MYGAVRKSVQNLQSWGNVSKKLEGVLNFKQRRFVYSPTTVGSKSTNTARGTCFPAPVSLKNVLKESSPPPIVLSLGIWPSGWIPCSKQYNSQQAFPIWTPAWPTWTEIHSRYETRRKSQALTLLTLITADNFASNLITLHLKDFCPRIFLQ